MIKSEQFLRNQSSETESRLKAIEDYTAAINLNPAEALAHSNRALAYDALGEA